MFFGLSNFFMLNSSRHFNFCEHKMNSFMNIYSILAFNSMKIIKSFKPAMHALKNTLLLSLSNKNG